MKVLMLAHEAPDDFKLRDDQEKSDSYMGEWYVFGDELSKAGIKEFSAALEGPTAATVVSVRDGKRQVQDGPYPDAKEQLGGFAIIEAKDLDEAAQWAKKCPAAKTGYVDVRVIPSLEEHSQ